MLSTKSNLTSATKSTVVLSVLLSLGLTVSPGYSKPGNSIHSTRPTGSTVSRGAVMQRDPMQSRDLANMQPLNEVRGLWVVRTSITSPEKIANVVDTARRYGFNALFVQVRGRGDAYYQSTLEPRSDELAKEPPVI